MNTRPSLSRTSGIAVLALLFFSFSVHSTTSVYSDIKKLSLTPANVYLADDGISTGDPSKLLDNQSNVGDPAAGDASNNNTPLDPDDFWRSTNGAHENTAIIDFGEEVRIEYVYIYDTNGVGDVVFSVGEPDRFTPVTAFNTNMYRTWRQVDINAVSRYLSITNPTGYVGIPEIVVYGRTSEFQFSALKKLELDTRDVTLLDDGMSSGDVTKLLDQQDAVGDPLNGDRVELDPNDFWKSTNGGHENYAIVDFGQYVHLQHILLYDTNGQGIFTFSAGDTNNWEVAANYSADRYKSWVQLDADVLTRYLLIMNPTGYAGMPEIVFYGREALPELGEVEKISLSGSNVSLADDGISTGDASLLLDEQDVVQDPLSGDRVALDPNTFWKSINGLHENVAIIDIGEEIKLRHIMLYDTNGVGTLAFSTGLPGAFDPQNEYLTSSYKSWAQVDFDVFTQFVEVTNPTGFVGVPELVVYGQRWYTPGADVPSSTDDTIDDGNDEDDDTDDDGSNDGSLPDDPYPSPEPGEGFGSNTHTTDSHEYLACTACDLVLGPEISDRYQVDVDFNQPGGLVCLQAGTYGRISLKNINGDATAPVTLKNCDGQVVVDSTSQGGFLLDYVRYINVSGTGDPAHLYGFDISTTRGEGVKVRNMSTDIELSYIKVTQAETTGFKAKPEYSGADPDDIPNAIMHNLHIHHTRVDYAGTMEGHYVGHTGCDGTNSEDEEYFSSDIWLENVDFHDNIIIDAGADGIQFACTRGRTNVYRNTILKTGERTFHDRTDQDYGIQLGPDLEKASVYNNYIANTETEAFHINPNGAGHIIDIYNNHIVNVKSAAYINASVTRDDGFFILRNNTFDSFTTDFDELLRTNSVNKHSNNGWIIDNTFIGVDPLILFDVDGSDVPERGVEYTDFEISGNQFQ